MKSSSGTPSWQGINSPVLTEQAVTGKAKEEKQEKQSEKKEGDCLDEKPIFDFFGIHVFSDDLLIIAILFFLYSEGVQDPELFIALVLLLIS